MNKGRLLLIPSALSPNKPEHFLPKASYEQVCTLTHFVAERAKTARHFLKDLNLPRPIQELKVVELNKHGDDDYINLLQPCAEGFDLGLLSEAGAPGVADPGGGLVKAAHELGIQVVPLVGPSSILLALMASGFNGQRFMFHGYLPKDGNDLTKRLNSLESDSRRNQCTQIFIETPYRNHKLLEMVLKTLHPETQLSIAADLLSPSEYVRSMSVSDWRKSKVNIEKRPTVFSIYAGENVK